ncbi:MAG: CAAX prenyl protease-related protein [Verrucomicrobia bacterium]|nr:CAAX prenyl protease-related protein [Verrucomicrobiota bacterium]
MKKLMAGPGFPFVAPFALFMGLLFVRQKFEAQGWWLYGVCALLVFGLILWLRPRYHSLDPAPVPVRNSILLGLGAIVLWIALDPWMPRTGIRDNSFPYEAAFQLGTAQGILAIFFRVFGAVIVVPIAEELFWRGYLMRSIIKPEFEEVPLATFQPLSFYVTTVAFALVHAEIGSAILFALIAGWWFIKTKSLKAVILLHAAANAGLAAYVLLTKNWFFW